MHATKKDEINVCFAIPTSTASYSRYVKEHMQRFILGGVIFPLQIHTHTTLMNIPVNIRLRHPKMSKYTILINLVQESATK